MKLYQDQSDPAAPMRLGSEPVSEQDVIDAVINASQAENPSALECVTGDLLLMSFLPEFRVSTSSTLPKRARQ
ncbi:hypothetical protein EEPDABAO_00032 [Klebsiella phage mfs]|uniref:Uncharacterized protein n=1 Tax=Klebsiella phage mfs TaxID=2985561 RepID=A0A9X9P162_9CAUD|nr:hypothetical protein EEPDABAO_00032 [Klebsiella phage mfs]